MRKLNDHIFEFSLKTAIFCQIGSISSICQNEWCMTMLTGRASGAIISMARVQFSIKFWLVINIFD